MNRPYGKTVPDSSMKYLYMIALFCFLQPAVITADDKLVHVIRFNDYEIGPDESWLQSKGFTFERDMRKPNFIDLDVTGESLVIEAKRRALGVLLNETVNVSEFSYIEIDWGVNLFPEDVSYEQGILSEAIMVVVFMGDENLPSGSIFIPDSPYFIGLFLCDGEDRVNYPYQGRYYKKQGRLICTDRPSPGESVTSRFNLFEGYRNLFDQEREDDPGISGLGILLDTRKAGNRGISSAFIKEIRIYH